MKVLYLILSYGVILALIQDSLMQIEILNVPKHSSFKQLLLDQL